MSESDGKLWGWQKGWIAVGVCFAVLFPAYLLSYVALSRRGYAEADRFGMKGFYYFTPEDTDAWRMKNYGCMYLFMPVNGVDRALGLGRVPASEPMWGLR